MLDRLLQRTDFLEILCRHYHLARYDAAGERTGQQAIPLFRSTLPLRNHAPRSLPFGYYLSADTLERELGAEGWQQLQLLAREEQANICVHTVGSCHFAEGFLVANNPVFDCHAWPEPMQAYTRSHRQNMNTEYNKAARAGITYSYSTDEASLQDFYRVLSTQYVKQHRMLFQPIGLFRDFLQGGFASLLLARHGKDVLGGMFLMRDGDRLHYMWGAMKRHQNLSIGALLVDHALRDACMQGIHLFNFGSTPLSDEALFAFKMKWGAHNLPVMQYATLHPQPLPDLNNAYPLPRRLYSLMPVWAMRALMPVVVPYVMS